MMNQREQVNDVQEGFRTMLADLRKTMWCAMPGIIQSYDAVEGTVSVQLTIRLLQTLADQTTQWIELPQLIHVPVYFFSGGGASITVPISAGDECLVVFSDRMMGTWWKFGGVQNPAILRSHDIHDGFAFVGFKSQPRRLTNVSTDGIEIRLDDESAFIRLGLDGTVRIKSPTGVTVEGDLLVEGTITATTIQNQAGIGLATHVHASGTPTTGPAEPPPV